MRKRKLCFFLFVTCLLLVILPIQALAGVLHLDKDQPFSDTEYYDSGALKKITVNYWWSGADCTSRLVLSTNRLKGSNSFSFGYGELTDLGEYGRKFNTFEEAKTFDKTSGKFGFVNWSKEYPIEFYEDYNLDFEFNDTDIPIDRDRDYYVYMWSYYQDHYYPDYLIGVIRVAKQEITFLPNTTGAFHGEENGKPFEGGNSSLSGNNDQNNNNDQSNNNASNSITTPSNTADVPKTGDNAQLMLWAALLAVSSVCFAILLRRRSS